LSRNCCLTPQKESDTNLLTPRSKRQQRAALGVNKRWFKASNNKLPGSASVYSTAIAGKISIISVLETGQSPQYVKNTQWHKLDRCDRDSY